MRDFASAGNIFLILCFIPAFTSVLVFSRVSWWRSRWGIHLMAYMVTMALLLLLGIVRLFFGETGWFDVLRAGAYVLFLIVLWWRMFYVIQAAHEGSPNESPKEMENK